MKKTLGEMINDAIHERGVKQIDLCRGLCSTSALSRYLNGERRMDRCLLTVLLQRLGKSSDKFITLLTDEEYSYFEWKQEICYAQMNKDWEMIYQLLQEKEAQNGKLNKNIQKQYYLLMQGIVNEKLLEIERRVSEVWNKLF